MWQRAQYLVTVLTLTACAASNSSSSSGLNTLAGAGRDVITATEIVAAKVTDAYQAVSQLRPEFLRRRMILPMPAFGQISIAVYLDEMPYGSVEALRSIPLDRVRLIRYISASDADLRWGGTHPAGAILVTTLK
jgi:hypothetical protein